MTTSLSQNLQTAVTATGAAITLVTNIGGLLTFGENVVTWTVKTYSSFLSTYATSGTTKKELLLSALRGAWSDLVDDPTQTFEKWYGVVANFIDTLHSQLNAANALLTTIKESSAALKEALFGSTSSETTTTA